jgi:hypothetical protein
VPTDPPLHREHRDHGLRGLFTIPRISLRRFGIPSAPMVRELSGDIKIIDTAVEEADDILEDEAGTVWVLEFERGSGNAARLIRHYAAAVQRHPRQRVELALFWDGARRPPRVRPVRAQRASVAAYQVFLASLDGRAALARLRAQAPAALSSDDALELALVPAMDHGGRPMWDVLEDLAPLAAGLDPEWAAVVVGAMGALAYDALEPAERPRLLEVLGRMPFPQTLFTDLERRGEERGEQRGALCQARVAVLEAFAARFTAVPDPVQHAVSQVADLDQLHRWLRAVVRARDEAEAARAVLED